MPFRRFRQWSQGGADDRFLCKADLAGMWLLEAVKSVVGQKRTSANPSTMSAFHLKADIREKSQR
jgi:hypothetical protein